MTRNEIQKSFKRICPPQHGEKQDYWFLRLSRCLGWSANRIKSLYKDDRCKLSLDEGIQLRKHLGTSVPTITADNQKLKDLNDKLQAQLLEAKQKQEKLDGQFKTMVSGLLALCKTLETGSNMGRS